MLSFIGRLFGKLSLSSIIANFDIDFKTAVDNGVFYVFVMVHIFGRRIYSERWDLLRIEDIFESVIDLDLVEKSDGEYLKIQMQLGGRVLFKKAIKVFDKEDADGEKRKLKADRFSIEEVNKMSTREIEKMLNDATLN